MLTGKGILSSFQRSFLQFFAGLPDQERFYLTGGTALAEYYLGHGLSYDLDLFTSEADLIVPFSYRVDQAAHSAGMQVTVVRRFASFVEFQIGLGEDQLKVDLALDAPFRFAPPELSDSYWFYVSIKKPLSAFGSTLSSGQSNGNAALSVRRWGATGIVHGTLS